MWEVNKVYGRKIKWTLFNARTLYFDQKKLTTRKMGILIHPIFTLSPEKMYIDGLKKYYDGIFSDFISWLIYKEQWMLRVEQKAPVETVGYGPAKN